MNTILSKREEVNEISGQFGPQLEEQNYDISILAIPLPLPTAGTPRGQLCQLQQPSIKTFLHRDSRFIIYGVLSIK